MANFVPSQFPSKKPCRIAFIAEAPGHEEDVHKVPLVGPSGALFNYTLKQLGIERADCLVGNVFSTRPPHNKVEHFFMTAKGFKKWCKETGLNPPPILRGSKLLHPDYHHELERLKKELQEFAPNIVVCMGSIALWAVAGYDGISKFRGNIEISEHLGFPVKFIGTFHPSAILRHRPNRVYFYHDIRKAVLNSDDKTIKVYNRTILVPDKLADIRNHFQKLRQEKRPIVYDIETDPKDLMQMTMIGFANSSDTAFVVPFISHNRPGRNYWPTYTAERDAKLLISELFSDESLTFIGHNSNYDREWLLRNGINVPRWPRNEDTMLLHHAIEPELKKGLDTLASLYLDEVSWKHLRKKTPKYDE